MINDLEKRKSYYLKEMVHKEGDILTRRIFLIFEPPTFVYTELFIQYIHGVSV